MILSANGSSIELPNPEYGYTSSIVMPVKYFESDCGYHTFDNGSENDYRICSVPGSLFTRSEMTQLSEFMLNQNQGRSEFTIDLGLNSGFYMFGPDLGDSGVFTVRMLNRKNSGLLIDPYLMYSFQFEIIMVEKPIYTLPAIEPQGNFQIGAISTLLFPQEGFQPAANYGYGAISTNSGALSVVDTNNNTYKTKLNLWANQSNAAHLINYLQSQNARGGHIIIKTPENYAPFGVENNEDGEFICVLISESDRYLKIDIKHIEHDQFRIPLTMWLKSCPT